MMTMSMDWPSAGLLVRRPASTPVPIPTAPAVAAASPRSMARMLPLAPLPQWRPATSPEPIPTEAATAVAMNARRLTFDTLKAYGGTDSCYREPACPNWSLFPRSHMSGVPLIIASGRRGITHDVLNP